MTPARRSVSPRDSSVFSAPRSLNDAVNCWFSNFRKTSAPVTVDRVREWRNGVSMTLPAMAAAARRTSSSVMDMQRTKDNPRLASRSRSTPHGAKAWDTDRNCANSIVNRKALAADRPTACRRRSRPAKMS